MTPVAIPLSCGARAFVDADDAPLLAPFKWHRLQSERGLYARTSMKVGADFKTVLMHRFLMKPIGAELVDHINGDGLDNRRVNLRLATPLENARNCAPKGRSGYTGVKWSGRKWLATITADGHEIYLGSHETAEEGAAAYNAAARLIFGSFAKLNDVHEPPGALVKAIAAKRAQILKLQSELHLLGASL